MNLSEFKMQYYSIEEANDIVNVLKKNLSHHNIDTIAVQPSGRKIIVNGNVESGALVYIRLKNGNQEYPINLLGEKYKAKHVAIED